MKQKRPRETKRKKLSRAEPQPLQATLVELHAVSSVEVLQLMLEAFLNADDSRDQGTRGDRDGMREGL